MRARLRTAWAVALTCSALAAVSSTRVARADDPTKQECKDAYEGAQRLVLHHKYLESRDPLNVCLQQACPQVFRDDCTKMMADVETNTPTIVFEVKDAAGNDVETIKVSIDGTLLVDHLDGSALNVDPGEHTFTFEVDGQPAVQRKLVIDQGQKNRAEVITLPKPPEVTPPPPVPTTTPTPTATGAAPVTTDAAQAPAPPPHADTTPKSHGTSPLVYLGFTLAGVGTAVGTITGLLAFSKASAVTAACIGTVCPTSADSDIQSGRMMGTVATVSFIAAGAGLGIGIVGLLTGGKSSSSEARHAPPRVSPYLGLGTAGVRGSF